MGAMLQFPERRGPLQQLMLAFLAREDEEVRLRCGGCGAHTQLGSAEYSRALRAREQVMCTVCGRMRALDRRRRPDA